MEYNFFSSFIQPCMEDHDKCHFKTESYRNMSYNDDELWFMNLRDEKKKKKNSFQIKRIIRVWHTKGLKMGKKNVYVLFSVTTKPRISDDEIYRTIKNWRKVKSVGISNMNIYSTTNLINS